MTNPLVQNILLFKRLSEYTAEQLHQVIKDESPQTIAVVLVRLEPKKVKEILALFPLDEQKDLVYRMATARDIPPEFLNEVANTIGSKLRVFDDEKKHPGVDSQKRMAEILKRMGPSKSQELLDALEKKDLGLADRLKRKMLAFDDLHRTELKGRRHAFARVDLGMLAVALKGADDEIKVAVWDALSENRRAMLRSEMKYIGPQKRSVVDRARDELMSILRGFYDQGILRMQGDRSDDEWV